MEFSDNLNTAIHTVLDHNAVCNLQISSEKDRTRYDYTTCGFIQSGNGRTSYEKEIFWKSHKIVYTTHGGNRRKKDILHLIASPRIIGYAFSQGISHSDSLLHELG